MKLTIEITPQELKALGLERVLKQGLGQTQEEKDGTSKTDGTEACGDCPVHHARGGTSLGRGSRNRMLLGTQYVAPQDTVSPLYHARMNPVVQACLRDSMKK